MKNNVEIISIKRKSDGKIFSIGDKFIWFSKGTIGKNQECGSYDQTFTGKIKEFKIFKDNSCSVIHLHEFSSEYNSRTIKGSNIINLDIDYLVN